MPANRTAAADQLEAASRDQIAMLHAAHPLIGGQMREEEPSPAFIARLDALGADLIGGRLPFCQHLDASPQPVYAALWDDAVVCGRCIGALARLTGDADRTCDLCGTVEDALYVAVVAVGPLVVMFGRCSTCNREDRP